MSDNNLNVNESIGPNDPNKFNIYTRTQPTKVGEQKPCDIDHSQDTTSPGSPNFIENVCFNWMRSKCKGRNSEFCPGYIYHKDPSWNNIPYPSTFLPTMGDLLGG